MSHARWIGNAFINVNRRAQAGDKDLARNRVWLSRVHAVRARPINRLMPQPQLKFEPFMRVLRANQ